MTPTDKAALRALAEAATQPRSAFDGQFWDFHNAVPPAAVLALLDDVDRLRRALRHVLDSALSLPRFAEAEARAALGEPANVG